MSTPIHIRTLGTFYDPRFRDSNLPLDTIALFYDVEDQLFFEYSYEGHNEIQDIDYVEMVTHTFPHWDLNTDPPRYFMPTPYRQPAGSYVTMPGDGADFSMIDCESPTMPMTPMNAFRKCLAHYRQARAS